VVVSQLRWRLLPEDYFWEWYGEVTLISTFNEPRKDALPNRNKRDTLTCRSRYIDSCAEEKETADRSPSISALGPGRPSSHLLKIAKRPECNILYRIFWRLYCLFIGAKQTRGAEMRRLSLGFQAFVGSVLHMQKQFALLARLWPLD
jgi:hypothetical protein